MKAAQLDLFGEGPPVVTPKPVPAAPSVPVPTKEPDADEDFADLQSAIHVIRTRYLTAEKKTERKRIATKLLPEVERLLKDLERMT